MFASHFQSLSIKTRQAYVLFYPLAAVSSIITIVTWTGQYLGFFDLDMSAQDHAHEMIFGFAPAVMTGFLLNGVKKINLILLVLIWLMGRFLPFINMVPAPLIALIQIIFPILLSLFVAVPLFRNAKTWRNFAFAPILVAFILAESLFQLGQLGYWDNGQERSIFFALNLICAMVFMMGGRVVTAVTNGAIQSLGEHLKPGKQSYWERKGLLCLIVLAIGDLSNIPLLSIIGNLGLFIALSMRIFHWQPHRLWQKPQCLWLHIGFMWLAIGILLRLFGHIFATPFDIIGIHTITIASLGTLTLTIMSRTTLQRQRSPIIIPKIILYALANLTLATFFRVAMELLNDRQIFMILSSFFFAIGFSFFLFWFVMTLKNKK